LNITTEPAASLVVVKSQGGKLLASAPAPVAVEFSGDTLTVEVEPAAEEAKSFLAAKKLIGTSQFDLLPKTGDKDRVLHVKLDKREFLDVRYVEIVLDAQRRFRGLITRSRAYVDTHEAGGTPPRRVVDFGDNLGIQGLAISPAGDRIIFSAASYEKIPDLTGTLSLNEDRMIDLKGCNLKGVTVSGGGIQQVTSDDFRDMFPAFTADGKSLLFSSNRRRPKHADLLLISASGRGGISNVYVDPREALLLRPSQAIDGTIAFAYYPEADNIRRVEVWTIGGENQFPTQITKGSQPMISPTGKRIAYIGEDGNLWVTDVTGANQVQLTSSAGAILKRYEESLAPDERKVYDISRAAREQSIMPYSYPSWSADGNNILYTAMEGTDPTGRPNEDVWIMRHDGSGKQQLTTNGSADRYPLMAPDGRAIYFMSNRGGHWGIWSIAAPGAAAPTGR
jgi:Tol biopolymer transport system component